MTRDEWLGATDPLELVNAVAGGLSDRKLRLFLAACCRRLQHLPVWPSLLEAVEPAEQFADGAGSQDEMERVRHVAGTRWTRGQGRLLSRKAEGAAFIVCLPPGDLEGRYHSFAGRYSRGSYVVMRGVDAAAEAAARYVASDDFEQDLANERAEQCRLLRDVVGDTFRFTAVEAAWLTPAVLGLAHAAYEERALPAGTLDPDRLAVLSDALEEAGCEDAEVLGHLRGPGPHVRGCSVVDLLLAKG